MRLRQLELVLEGLEAPAASSPALEQYRTPPDLAARMLHHAWMRGDIAGKKVCDLGTGNGILACGAALLGASETVGVDVDPLMISVARRNAERIGLVIRFVIADVASGEAFHGMRFDTVVMNPPFGAQRRHADRAFIDRALSIARVIYTIENAGSSRFLEAYTKGRARIDEIIASTLAIPRMFSFHQRERREIEVEIVRLVILADDSHAEDQG